MLFSRKETITSSQWIALDILSAMFRGPLPVLHERNENLPSWMVEPVRQANMTRAVLWKLLDERLCVQHREITRVEVDWGKICKKEELPLEARCVGFVIHSRVRVGPLPDHVRPFVMELRLRIQLSGDVGEWYAERVRFEPSADQEAFFAELPRVYRLVP